MKWPYLTLSVLACMGNLSLPARTNPVRCKEYVEVILTHELVAAGPLPTVMDPDGVYPYLSYCETSHRPAPKAYRMMSLENEKIAAVICPDLCGNKSTGVSVYPPGLSRPVWGKTGWPASARIGNMNNQLSLRGNNIRPFRPGGIDRPGRKSTDKKRRG